MEHSDTFAWYRDELHRAAQEQLFGVTSVGKLREYTEEELQSDVPSAEIPITLLEGNTINVRLSLAGYSVSIYQHHHDLVAWPLNTLLDSRRKRRLSLHLGQFTPIYQSQVE